MKPLKIWTSLENCFKISSGHFLPFEKRDFFNIMIVTETIVKINFIKSEIDFFSNKKKQLSKRVVAATHPETMSIYGR